MRYNLREMNTMEKKKKTAKILNIAGTLVIVAVILLVLPLTVPKVFGLKLFNVISGSMEPLYEVGGVIYVREAEVSDVEVGDVISYVYGSGTDVVITHRVVEIKDDAFITKGDANNVRDPEPVMFSRLVGKPVFYLPFFGTISDFIFSVRGICVGIVVFGIAIALWLYADMLAPSEKKKKNASEGVPDSEKEKPASKGFDVTKLGIVIVVLALLAGGVWGFAYFSARTSYDDIREEFTEELVTLPEGEAEGAGAEGGNGFFGGNATAGFLSEATPESIALGFEKVSGEYKNLVGWILLPDSPINYPVMQASDDDYYLHHAYTGKYSRVGSIFLTAQNSRDFSDRYNILYGHNMIDDSMFGPLLNYDRDSSYIESHPSFFIATSNGVSEYEIFSYFYAYPDDSMYLASYYNANDFDLLTQNMTASSKDDLGLSADATDDIVLLSTCSNSGKFRFVVCGKRK